MKPPPLASDAHPGFIHVDGVKILLQRQPDRLHDRFPAIGHLTDAAHYRAGPQPNLPFLAKPLRQFAGREAVGNPAYRRCGRHSLAHIAPEETLLGERRLASWRGSPVRFKVRSMKGDLTGTVRPIKPWAALSLHRGHLAQVSMAVLALLDPC